MTKRSMSTRGVAALLATLPWITGCAGSSGSPSAGATPASPPAAAAPLDTVGDAAGLTGTHRLVMKISKAKREDVAPEEHHLVLTVGADGTFALQEMEHGAVQNQAAGTLRVEDGVTTLGEGAPHIVRAAVNGTLWVCLSAVRERTASNSLVGNHDVVDLIKDGATFDDPPVGTVVELGADGGMQVRAGDTVDMRGTYTAANSILTFSPADGGAPRAELIAWDRGRLVLCEDAYESSGDAAPTAATGEN